MTEDRAIPEALLSRFSAFVAARLGLHFPPERWHELARGARSCAPLLGCKNAATCMEWLLAHPVGAPEIQRLASYLTVGETYFFREEPIFAALKSHILPELIQRRAADRHLRIWSAGCCSGEEPYSLAILLTQMIPNLKDWKLMLLATDINLDYLAKAQRAQYGQWSFRRTPPSIKEHYFRPVANQRVHTLDEEIRRRVSFAYLNLAEDGYPSLLNGTNGIDILFCRNVLMYFQPEHVPKVISKLYACLADDGWLVVSPSEASSRLFPQFTPVNFRDAVVFRKSRAELPMIASDSRPPTAKAHRSFAQTAVENAPPEHPQSSRRQAATVSTPTPHDRLQEADTLCGQGRYQDAVDILQALLVQDSENPRLMTRLAKACANQGRLVEALTWCERAITADKLDPTARYLLAIILQEQGRDLEAVAALKHALYLDPSFALAHFALGNSLRAQGHYKESRRYFANTLAIFKEDRRDHCPPESDGMTVGKLRDIIQTIMSMDHAT